MSSADASGGWLHSDAASPKHGSSTAPVMTVGGDIVSDVCDSSSAQLPADADEMLLILSGVNDASAAAADMNDSHDSQSLHELKQTPVFFKSALA